MQVIIPRSGTSFIFEHQEQRLTKYFKALNIESTLENNVGENGRGLIQTLTLNIPEGYNNPKDLLSIGETIGVILR